MSETETRDEVDLELLDSALNFARRTEELRTAGAEGGVPVLIAGDGEVEARWHQAEYLTRDWRWNDDGWCGAGCCVAGWVALAAGAEPRWTPFISDDRPEYAMYVYSANDVIRSVGDFAERRLGLTLEMAAALFHGFNDLDDLEAVAAAIRSGDRDDETYRALRRHGAARRGARSRP